MKKFLKYGNRQKIAQDLRLGDIVERHMVIVFGILTSLD
jgi:DNA-directed RNA polymerase III subunit RPC1